MWQSGQCHEMEWCGWQSCFQPVTCMRAYMHACMWVCTHVHTTFKRGLEIGRNLEVNMQKKKPVNCPSLIAFVTTQRSVSEGQIWCQFLTLRAFFVGDGVIFVFVFFSSFCLLYCSSQQFCWLIKKGSRREHFWMTAPEEYSTDLGF